MLHIDIVTKELSLHRLENEHLNNCGKFRAVRDISVAPLDASDQQQIIKLMDETDPSSLFRKKKLFKSPAPIVDPQKVPLLGDLEKKTEKGPGGSLGLKSFHLGESQSLTQETKQMFNVLFQEPPNGRKQMLENWKKIYKRNF